MESIRINRIKANDPETGMMPFPATEVFISTELDPIALKAVEELLTALGFDYMDAEGDDTFSYTTLADGSKVHYWGAIGNGYFQD